MQLRVGVFCYAVKSQLIFIHVVIQALTLLGVKLSLLMRFLGKSQCMCDFCHVHLFRSSLLLLSTAVPLNSWGMLEAMVVFSALIQGICLLRFSVDNPYQIKNLSSFLQLAGINQSLARCTILVFELDLLMF